MNLRVLIEAETPAVAIVAQGVGLAGRARPAHDA